MREMRRHAGGLALPWRRCCLFRRWKCFKPWPLKVVIDSVLGGAKPQFAWLQGIQPANLLPLACLALIALYLCLSVLQVSITT